MSIKLKVNLKEADKNPKEIRSSGLIPAILYGYKTENTALTVDRKEFNKVFKEAGESTIIELEIVGEKKSEKRPVLIHDLQFDNLGSEISHIDFYQVNLEEKIETKVPVSFMGESPAVKGLGGILVKAVQELEVEALPQDLPHQLEVDLSVLVDFNSNIYVKDLNLPKGVKILAAPETVLASVIPPRSEEELAAAQETSSGDLSQIKVESEEKKAQREAEKTVKEKE